MSDWIEWNGGECPVPKETPVEGRLRNGETINLPASAVFWGEIGALTVVAYRVVETGDWVAWKGGECPVEEYTTVEYRMRCGTVTGPFKDQAGSLRWEHDGGDADIIAYRVPKLVSVDWNIPPSRSVAEDYLEHAAAEMRDRAASRDTESERSMGRAVRAFWEIYGEAIMDRGRMTETEGWEFMSVLKKVRGAQGEYREDDYVDDIAYCALAAESASDLD